MASRNSGPLRMQQSQGLCSSKGAARSSRPNALFHCASLTTAIASRSDIITYRFSWPTGKDLGYWRTLLHQRWSGAQASKRPARGTVEQAAVFLLTMEKRKTISLLTLPVKTMIRMMKGPLRQNSLLARLCRNKCPDHNQWAQPFLSSIGANSTRKKLLGLKQPNHGEEGPRWVRRPPKVRPPNVYPGAGKRKKPGSTRTPAVRSMLDSDSPATAGSKSCERTSPEDSYNFDMMPSIDSQAHEPHSPPPTSLHRRPVWPYSSRARHVPPVLAGSREAAADDWQEECRPATTQAPLRLPSATLTVQKGAKDATRLPHRPRCASPAQPRRPRKGSPDPKEVEPKLVARRAPGDYMDSNVESIPRRLQKGPKMPPSYRSAEIRVQQRLRIRGGDDELKVIEWFERNEEGAILLPSLTLPKRDTADMNGGLEDKWKNGEEERK
ncbi:hypothetical protein K490DRAFT_58424 [Saccharata proteae CBS 121410]|uniref:Uncharacterized protein n=1 Tax=Saccharata proteae CBS 121410 TaxID=1314787 RepID=A0A9P4LYB0_9PEZI|nr:hypothetical protein K490DRAFT_58424 [Saccharata proteae CBS 121410]